MVDLSVICKQHGEGVTLQKDKHWCLELPWTTADSNKLLWQISNYLKVKSSPCSAAFKMRDDIFYCVILGFQWDKECFSCMGKHRERQRQKAVIDNDKHEMIFVLSIFFMHRVMQFLWLKNQKRNMFMNISIRFKTIKAD